VEPNHFDSTEAWSSFLILVTDLRVRKTQRERNILLSSHLCQFDSRRHLAFSAWLLAIVMLNLTHLYDIFLHLNVILGWTRVIFMSRTLLRRQLSGTNIVFLTV
jgi:hypothetical protein